MPTRKRSLKSLQPKPMTSDLHLQPRHRRLIETLADRHVPGIAIWAYGSRVNGQSHDASDLDIVLRGPDLGETPTLQLAAFEEALRESTLPFLVDLHDWARLPESFHRRIERQYVVLREPASGNAQQSSAYRPTFPAHWVRKPLYSMAQWVNGLAFRDIEFSATGRPVIKIAEIKNGITAQTKFTRQEFDDSVCVREGDLLFSWSGQPETSIDAFRWHGPTGWLNQHVFRVTPSSEVDVDFFFYLLKYLKPNFVDIARNKQTTGLGHVTKRDLKGIVAALPDLTEQRAIVYALGALDDKIELSRRMANALEEVIRTAYEFWFTDGGRVFGETGTLTDVARLNPESWTASTLPDNVTYVDLSNTKWGRIERTGTYAWHDAPSRARRVLRPGDTIVGMVRPGNGSHALVGVEGLTGSTGFAVLRPKDDFDALFVWCAATSTTNINRLAQLADGGAYPAVSSQAIAATEIALTNVTTRKRFSGLTAALGSRMLAAYSDSHKLTELRDTLLSRLISGQLRVLDARELTQAAT